MSKTLLLIVLVSLLMSESPKPMNASKLAIKEKKISVHGKTSIGNFTCNYDNLGRSDTLFVDFGHRTPDLIFDIVVEEFGCGNFILNRDFKKTLKSKEYPKARVRVGGLSKKDNRYFCNLSVNLVGKKLDFPNQELHHANGGITTHIDLSFSTLGLQPPSKMGGLVTVEEQLKLEIFLGLANPIF